MLEWQHTLTGKINKFTKERNWIYYFPDNSHCLVYKRRKSEKGWGYTCRIPGDNIFIQESTRSNYFEMKEAQERALASMKHLKELIN